MVLVAWVDYGFLRLWMSAELKVAGQIDLPVQVANSYHVGLDGGIPTPSDPPAAGSTYPTVLAES